MLNRPSAIISLSILILFSIIVFPVLPCLAVSPTEKNILIMHAFTQDYPVHEAFNKGLKSKFQQDYQFKINYSYEYLDLARFENSENYLAETAHYFQAKYSNRLPEMIITSSILAPFLQKYGKDIFPGVPVLVVSKEDNVPIENISADFVAIPDGLDETVQADKNIQLILQTRPFIQKIYIVVGDSEVERKIVERLQQVTYKFADKVQFVYLNKLSYDQMMEHIRNSSDRSAILFLRWNVDVEGKRFIPAQVLQAICRYSKAPIYGEVAHLLGSGILGGYVYNHEISGKNVAEVGLDILTGKKTSDISVTNVPVSEYVFDWRELKRWGIDEEKLPPGSRIEYREYSAWELYKGYIIGGIALLLLETALVLGLLVNRSRRRRAESELMQLNMTLGKRVFERTQELQDANNQLTKAQELLEALNQQLDLTSRTDSLTGLYNRRHMEERIQEEYEQYQRTGSSFALIMADIDFFKKVNDMYGHDVGDCVLKSVAEYLRKSVKAYDIVSRWGGEEFLLLLPATNAENAVGLAERIRKTVEEHRCFCEGEVLSVTLTAGVSVIRRDDTIGSIIRKADIALYQGKRLGRNCVVSFEGISNIAISGPQ